ncbi:MAG: tRNA pseudouridine(38-40) synthase TruA [Deltaproteobacteria bacterium]|nr:MAG: tRNA pseudouridine(38-40) synthase TruA [Deltaproteobacteria bacterium]
MANGETAKWSKRNYKLVLEYDGTNYHGWQRQKGVLTIQEVVETRLAIMTQAPIRLIGAGRTDAGVHARGQVANFLSGSRVRPENLLRGLNSLLPDDIVALELNQVSLDFHARFHALSKVYEYRIHNGPVAPALGRQYDWHISQPLSWGPMGRCLKLLEGRHDFASFQAAGSSVRNSEREIFSTRIASAANHLWVISIEANGFLRHMVRNIVGTLVEVGRGKLSEEGFIEVLTARDRKQAGMTAPARGLCLMEVRY